jgi:hypothetical protein
MLSLEFVLYAMRNPEVMPKLAVREQEELAAYSFAAAAQHQALGVPLPATAEQLGTIVRSVERGFLIHEYITGSEPPGEELINAMVLLLRASAALAAQEAAVPELASKPKAIRRRRA